MLDAGQLLSAITLRLHYGDCMCNTLKLELKMLACVNSLSNYLDYNTMKNTL